MKILVYSNCALDPTLGSGKTRVRFSAGLRSRGHEVRVVTPPEFEFAAPLGLGKRFRLAWGALRHAQRTLARDDYDVVEINGGEFGWLAQWLQRQPRRPLLVHRTDGCELLAWKFADEKSRCIPESRAALPRRWAAKAHRALDQVAFHSVDACVALSGADCIHVQQAAGLAPESTRVIRPGLDDEYLACERPTRRPPRVAFLGSWVERKGVDMLVESARRILAEYPAVELDLLGTGRAPETILPLFSPMADRVRVAGPLTAAEMAARLSLAGIFVLPSRYEGYGMATAEAMACGCAVITTRTGFGADLTDDTDALLVRFESANHLHAALQRLVCDESLRLRLATAGWTRVQSHQWSQSVAALESTYVEWLALRRRSPPAPK